MGGYSDLYHYSPTTKSPPSKDRRFWEQFSDPGVGPFWGGEGRLLKFSHIGNSFHIITLLCVICTLNRTDVLIKVSGVTLKSVWKSAACILMCLLYLMTASVFSIWRASFFLGCALWRCFAPSEGYSLVFGRLLGYALRAAHQTLASVFWEGTSLYAGKFFFFLGGGGLFWAQNRNKDISASFCPILTLMDYFFQEFFKVFKNVVFGRKSWFRIIPMSFNFVRRRKIF